MQSNMTAPMPPSVLLPKYMAVFSTLWQATLMGMPYARITDIHDFDVFYTQEDHEYTASYYDADKEEQKVGNPLPPEFHLLWPQLANTRQCERFALLLHNMVEKQLKLLFGDAVTVRWVICKPKPICVFVPNEDLAAPTFHSVLEIILPDKTSWIFDGTIAQYGYDFLKVWLVPKDVYEANYTLPADEPFWDIEQKDIDHFVEEIGEEHGGYWMIAWERMEKVMLEIDWQGLAECTLKQVCIIAGTLALTAFEGVWEEACERAEERSEEEDEEVSADDE